MKYFPLIWAALWRRKARTILTLLSVTAAFTLFGVMMGTDAAFRRAEDVINRKVAVISARFADNLTDAMGQEITAMPNVGAVSPGGTVFGYYRDPKTRAYAMMVGDAAGWPNLPLSPEQWAQWRARPDGVFLSRLQAAQWSLKKGDIFTIIAPTIPRADGGQAWRFRAGILAVRFLSHAAPKARPVRSLRHSGFPLATEGTFGRMTPIRREDFLHQTQAVDRRRGDSGWGGQNENGGTWPPSPL